MLRTVKVALLVVILWAAPGRGWAEELTLRGTAQVYFSPDGGAQAALTREIGAARESVLAQAYYLSAVPVAKALAEAKRRGVRVEVILDKSQRADAHSAAGFLARAGVAVCFDAEHDIAHNKVMVFDEKTVVTGSYNFTRAAEERNAENLLILRDPGLVKAYLENWRAHRGHCEAY
jgi:phosphatidylserine/phosphatidylglycerophosphate/cardiolipin synthase-like enzyme